MLAARSEDRNAKKRKVKEITNMTTTTTTIKKITLAQVNDNVHGFDSISKKGNVFTFRRGFFYSHGSDGDTFAARMIANLSEKFPQASWKVVETDMVWKPFRGGASVRASSHYMAKIEQVG